MNERSHKDPTVPRPFGPALRCVATFLADDSGKISIVSIPVVMLVGMLIAFIVNTGTTVREKIRLQNAADAGASTASLWMARSMNAVTTTNHLIGEATAVLAICDGFGGPMLYTGDKVFCPESKRYNDSLQPSLAAMVQGGAISQSLAHLDKKIVDKVWDLVTRDKGYHAGGAALYDGKMTLKHFLSTCFFGKQLANVALEVAIVVEKTPASVFGTAIEVAAIAAHEFLTLQVVAIGKEWIILEALEGIVGTVNADEIITKPIASVIIPGLSAHADTVVTGGLSGSGHSPPMGRAIQQSLTELASSYGVDSISLMPTATDLRLPVVKESPSPSRQISNPTAKEREKLGPWEQPKATAWTGKGLESSLEKDVERILGPLKNQVGKVGSTLNSVMKPYRKVSSGLPYWFDDAKKALSKIDSFSSLLVKFPSPIPKGGSLSNPCYGPNVAKDLQVPPFYWRAESRSQWVRATHPYVDDRRGGIVMFLRKQAPLSNIATYFVHWTDRYTLVRAHLRRREEPKNTTHTPDSKGLLDELRQKIADLRSDFNQALTVDSEASPDTPSEFEDIAERFIALVRNVGGSLGGIEEWAARVTSMPSDITAMGKAAGESPPDEMAPEDAGQLAEQLTRIALLDELLSLAESLLDFTPQGPPHMYVISGMDGTNKGNEPWTTDPRLAGRMFGVLATASAPSGPRFLDRVLFGRPSGTRIALSGALVADGNGIHTQGAKSSHTTAFVQADTGWDTLNWQAPVSAWEWGDHPPRTDGPPAENALNGESEAGRRARVRLAWEGLLVPIEGFGLRDSRQGAGGASKDPFIEFGDLLMH